MDPCGQGGVRIFDAGVKILTRRRQSYRDAQCMESVKGMVQSIPGTVSKF